MNALPSMPSPNTGPLTCFCSGHCQDGSPNGTCVLRSGGWCFTFVQEVVDTVKNALEPEYAYGCLTPDESGYMQCQGDLSPHEIPRSIKCCRGPEPLCNLKLRPVIRATPEEDFLNELKEYDRMNSLFGLHPDQHWILIPFFILLAILIILCVVLIKVRCSGYSDQEPSEKKSRKEKKKDHKIKFTPDFYDDGYDGSTTGSLSSHQHHDSMTDSRLDDVPLLDPPTMARELEFLKVIGTGRYGNVFYGRFRGNPVAIKAFATTEEKSWRREETIYRTPLIRHENILGFYNCVIRGTGGVTQMLLVTDYHAHGSLFDFLSTHVLNEESALSIMHSISSGLCHLHSDIVSRQRKPGIAHRDIKSKNILVKDDMTCCLADFGLSVTFESASRALDLGDENNRVGTKRYMAPEVLDNSMDLFNFESYKQADIYSLSLVLWEVCRRVILEGQEDEYQFPYQGLVPTDPSIEDMRALVCDSGVRPGIKDSWRRSSVLVSIVKMMQEGWSSKCKVRPTARKVKKDLTASRDKFLKKMQEEERKETKRKLSEIIVTQQHAPPNVCPEVSLPMPDMLQRNDDEDSVIKKKKALSSSASSYSSSGVSSASKKSFDLKKSNHNHDPLDHYILPRSQRLIQ